MLERFFDWAASLPPEWQGFIMSFVISILRVIYDAKETRPMRIFLEALICGGLSLCASTVISWLGLPQSLSIAAGGAIGFIGVMKIRQLALRYFNTKAGK